MIFSSRHFPQKWTNEFYFTTMKPQVDLFSFVFWRKLKTPKRHFKIIWPLEIDAMIKRVSNEKYWVYFLALMIFFSTFTSLSFMYYKKESLSAILRRKHFRMVITKIDLCAMLKLECSKIRNIIFEQSQNSSVLSVPGADELIGNSTYHNFTWKICGSINESVHLWVCSRQGNLAGLKLKSGLFKHISGPRLGANLIMNKNSLLFPMCSCMTLRRPQMSLDSRYFQEDMKNLKRE